MSYVFYEWILSRMCHMTHEGVTSHMMRHVTHTCCNTLQHRHMTHEGVTSHIMSNMNKSCHTWAGTMNVSHVTKKDIQMKRYNVRDLVLPLPGRAVGRTFLWPRSFLLHMSSQKKRVHITEKECICCIRLGVCGKQQHATCVTQAQQHSPAYQSFLSFYCLSLSSF